MIFYKTNQFFSGHSFLLRLFFEIVRSALIKSGISDEMEIQYLFLYIQAGLIICIREWFENDCDVPPAEYSKVLFGCVQNAAKDQRSENEM